MKTNLILILLAVIAFSMNSNPAQVAQPSAKPGLVLEEYVFKTAPFRSCHAETYPIVNGQWPKDKIPWIESEE